MHMIYPSMPIRASTEITEFLYTSCRKNITAPPFGAHRLLAPCTPTLYPPPLIFMQTNGDVCVKCLRKGEPAVHLCMKSRGVKYHCLTP